MDRGSITSGAAFKAAFRATLIFASVLMIASVVAYVYIQQELHNAVFSQLQDDRALLSQIYADGGRKKLIDALDQFNAPIFATRRAFGLYDAKGAKLTGNIAEVPQFAGWRETALAPGPPGRAPAAPEDYQLLSTAIGPMRLVLGLSLSEIKVQEDRMLVAFLTLGLVMSATFLAIGYFGSVQSLAKLARIASTLDRVSRGESDTRLEVSAANDQIDRVSRAMNLHLDRLSTMLATTRASVAALAHDLRTPLSRAVLATEKAIALAETNADPQDALAEVEAELARLRSVFDAILRISRLESGAASLDPHPVSVALLMDDLKETFGPVAEEKGQFLRLAPVSADLVARTDAALLTQLMANLIQNAINHCPTGSGITLGAALEEGGIGLFVSDTGPGIPEAEREKVFDLFYQVSTSRTKGGNGLGLALVKAVAERIGATVRLGDAAPGLRVDVRLPDDMALQGAQGAT